MTEWKRVKTEDELFTARLPQVYLRRKDCVSIKLGGSRWEIDELSSTPPHHTPSGAPTTTPIVAYTLYLLEGSVGEGVGGGGGGEQSSSIFSFLGNTEIKEILHCGNAS